MKIRVTASYGKVGVVGAKVLQPLFEKYGKVTLIEEQRLYFPMQEIICFFEMSDEEGKTAIEGLNDREIPRSKERIRATKCD